MRLGIDIDDTICKTNEVLIKEALKYDKKFLLGKGFKDKTKYKFVEKFYWNANDVRNFFNSFDKKGFFKSLDAYPDALKYINKLYDEGNEIYFITHRSVSAKEETKEWLEMQGFKYHKLILGIHDKGIICKQEKVDFFVDDTERNVKDALKFGVDALMFESVCMVEDKNIRVVHSWGEIYNYLSR